VSFSGLSAGTHTIAVKLNGIGLRLLKKNGYKLRSLVRLNYASGSASIALSADILLTGVKPRKR
jgi:hypothetical protein